MIYKFLDFELDTDVQELRKAGVACAIEPQVFDLLHHLIEHRDRLVSRDELFENIWQGRIVSDATLSSRVKAARKVVGDTGKKQSVIQTLPKRGFRFVADVDAGTASPGSAATAAASVTSEELLPLPDKPSIAVLPFENMSGDPEQEYFADGMAEDIITGLSKFHGLFVIARHSTFTYKGRTMDVKAVARDLGVRYVLEGSVRRAGQRIRVTGQLIDAASDHHIWAERYDRELDDLFAIQDEITSAIVAAIEPELGVAERERVLRRAPETLDAWGLYQKGLAAYYSSSEEGFLTAIDHFDQVNAIDPDFALAFAMGADTRCRYIANWNPEGIESDKLAVAAEKVQRAIALDPRDSMCLAADARVRAFQGQFDLAISKAQQAVTLNPNHALAHHIRGAVLMAAHRSREALGSFDEAIRLSPNSVFMAGFQMMRAMALFQLERFDEAMEWARQSVHAANPRVLAFQILVASLSQLDQMTEAEAVLNQLYERQPKFRISRISGINNDLLGPKFIEALRKAGVPE